MYYATVFKVYLKKFVLNNFGKRDVMCSIIMVHKKVVRKVNKNFVHNGGIRSAIIVHDED